MTKTTVKTKTPDEQIRTLTRRLERERAARKESEAIAERATSDLYEKVEALRIAEEELRSAYVSIEQRIKQRTAELRWAFEEAEASTRAKSRFLANMSHEIRTPLNGVLGTVHILRSTELSEEQAGWLDTIADSGEALVAVLGDILDFSKIEANELTLECVDLDLRKNVLSVQQLFEAGAQEKQIELTSEIHPDVPLSGLGDPTRVRQILSNLVSNAVKFTAVGSVAIAVRTVSSGADHFVTRFEVADTGPGIPADARDAIFDPFRQADDSMTRTHGGTGLGLAICQNLVTLMGGTIGLESTLDEGTTFWFEVPLKTMGERTSKSEVQGQHQGDEPSKEVCPLKGKRILVVEDNLINQTVVGAMLEIKECVVDIANDGREAVTHVATNTYDGILMDCQMPIMDGFEATAEIRKIEAQGAHLPIIALTGLTVRGDRERCIEAGMDDYLTKPLDPDELYRVLEKHLCSD